VPAHRRDGAATCWPRWCLTTASCPPTASWAHSNGGSAGADAGHLPGVRVAGAALSMVSLAALAEAIAFAKQRAAFGQCGYGLI
jgi:hypothetical protein